MKWGGGLNRSAVGKTASSTSGQPQLLASSALTSLVTCTSALRRAILGHGDACGRLRSLPSYYGRPAPFPARAPYPSIQSTLKQRPCQSRLRPPRLYTQGRRGRSEAAVGHGLAYTRFCRRRNPDSVAKPVGRRLGNASASSDRSVQESIPQTQAIHWGERFDESTLSDPSWDLVEKSDTEGFAPTPYE